LKERVLVFRAQYIADDDVQNCATCDCEAIFTASNLTVQRPQPQQLNWQGGLFSMDAECLNFL
jgi:hypothetical protein